jgi:hypothetical protein
MLRDILLSARNIRTNLSLYLVGAIVRIYKLDGGIMRMYNKIVNELNGIL